MSGPEAVGQARDKEGIAVHCSACGREITDTPLVFGPLTLCPQGCVPEPKTDLSAQVERYALASVRKSRRYR